VTNGIVGSELAAKSAPDGYTLVMGTAGTHGINASLFPKLPYDTVKDFAPITRIGLAPYLLVAHPSLPVRSVKDLIELARASRQDHAIARGAAAAARRSVRAARRHARPVRRRDPRGTRKVGTDCQGRRRPARLASAGERKKAEGRRQKKVGKPVLSVTVNGQQDRALL